MGPGWEQLEENERRQWEEERAWSLDRDPHFLEWLQAETARIYAAVNEQQELDL